MFKKSKSQPLQKIYNVVALGNTGVGKSSLLNMLGSTNMFKVGEEADAQTQITVYNTNQLLFMGETNEINLCLVDTPGLCDGNGDEADVEHIKNIVERIRELKQIDLFILCLEYTNPRLTASVKSTIQLFMNIFPEFISHTVIVFNKSFNLNADMRQKRLETFKIKIKELEPNSGIAIFFIDSNFTKSNETNDLSETEKMKYNEIQELKNYLISKKNHCDVINIVPVQTERQIMNERLRKLEEELENKRKEILEANKIIETHKQLEKQKKKKKKIAKIVGGGGGTTAAVIVILIIAFL